MTDPIDESVPPTSSTIVFNEDIAALNHQDASQAPSDEHATQPLSKSQQRKLKKRQEWLAKLPEKR